MAKHAIDMSHTCNLVLNNQSLSRILDFKSSFVTILLCFSLFFFVQPPSKVCIANRNIGQNFFFKQIYFSYSSLCYLFYQARHLRRWDQSAVSILYLNLDPTLEVICIQNEYPLKKSGNFLDTLHEVGKTTATIIRALRDT